MHGQVRHEVAGGETERRGHRVAPVDGRPERRRELRHPGEAQPAAVPLEIHGRRSDPKPEAEARGVRTDDARLCERECAADRRMAGHWHLDRRREDPHAHVGARRFSRQDERALGKIHLARERLHALGREPAAVEEDGELVAGQRLVGEDVVVEQRQRHGFGLSALGFRPPATGYALDRSRSLRPTATPT